MIKLLQAVYGYCQSLVLLSVSRNIRLQKILDTSYNKDKAPSSVEG